MKRIIKVLLVICFVFIDLSLQGSVRGSPLILSGVDTLLIEKKIGFDFVEQKACTSFSDYPGCHNHFWFQYYQPPLHYNIVAPLGYGVKMGMMNLDSLKTAPPDSVFTKNEEQTADAIPTDSLFYRIGHLYIIKTGKDPRDQTIRFAKIRILNFKVLDSANRKVEMRFLRACNVTGPRRELETSGLDTFNLNTPVISRELNDFKKKPHKTVFKVVGDRFIVPKELIGTGAYLAVYDLTGKRLGRVKVRNQSEIDLLKIKGSRGGMRVMWVERNYSDELANLKSNHYYTNE